MLAIIRTHFMAIMFAVVACIAISPQGVAASSSADKATEAAIKQQIQNYEQAVNSGKIDSVMRLYTKDAVFMAQNSAPAVGQEAVRSAYCGLFQALKLNIVFEFDEVQQVSEDWAYVRTRSTGSLSLLAGSKTTLPESNQEMFLLHREADGQWRITHYIFATNLSDQ